MRYPTFRHSGEGKDRKTYRRSNLDDRNELIAQMGAEYFYSCEEYEYLRDISIPSFFVFEFNVFMELYNLAGEDGISWQGIYSWEKVRKTKLSQREIDIILNINNWANQTISELKDNED